MDKGEIRIKQTVNGLILYLDKDDDFKSICRKLEKKLKKAGSFFNGASLDVAYRGRHLEKNQEEELAELMKQVTGAEIQNFGPDETETGNSGNMPIGYFSGIDKGITMFHRGTVRSGQSISYFGNLVIIGDVNPGSEVKAGGNIIVMGSLRGTVHAGHDGNKRAFIAAFSLNPTQLRIAEIIARAPDGADKKSGSGPEIAYVHEDKVYIDSISKNSLS